MERLLPDRKNDVDQHITESSIHVLRKQAVGELKTFPTGINHQH